MKLKRSDYILSAIDNSGNLLLLNTFNQAFIKILAAQKDKFIEFIRQPEIELDETRDFVVKLKEMGFLVRADIDEDRKIEDLYIKTCHSKNELDLIILPTEKCNFRCVYCYESFEKGKMDEKMQDAIVKYVKRELKNYQSLSVSWFGGEPLLALDVIENLSEKFIAICKEQKKHYFAHMTTNGHLLSLETFKKLFKLNVLRYQITIDGLKELHDTQRVLINGDGTFDRIIGNLTDIRDNFPSKLFRIKLRSNFLTTADGEKIKEYYEFYQKEFGNDKRFEIELKKAWNEANNKKIEDKIFSHEKFDKILKTVEVGSVDVLNSIKREVETCYAAKSNSLVIGADGKLYKCTVSFDKDINNIGFIDEKGTARIDNDKFTYYTNLSKLNRDHCNKCPLLPYCLGCTCPNNRNNTSKCKEFIISALEKIKICSNIAQIIEMEI